MDLFDFNNNENDAKPLAEKMRAEIGEEENSAREKEDGEETSHSSEIEEESDVSELDEEQ